MDNINNNDRIIEFLEGTLLRLGLDVKVEPKETEDGIVFCIVGESASQAIGHRGELLDALQYLATMVVEEDGKRIYVDAENYREKRKRILTHLAEKLAYKAMKTRRPQALEPMNPYERRIIHCALQNSEYAETISEGEGRFRHIVVVPKEMINDGSYEESKAVSYESTDFSRRGPGKMRSFGQKRRRF